MSEVSEINKMSEVNHQFNSILNSLNCKSLAESERFWVKPLNNPSNQFAYLILRINPNDDGVEEKLATIKITPPTNLSFNTLGESQWLLSLSQDEYLFIIPNQEKKKYQQQIHQALSGQNYALVDVSGTYSFCQLGGSHLYYVLSQGVYYDFENQLPQGKVISSLLAKAPSIFFRVEHKSIHWLCRNSFIVYAYHFLEKASM